MDVVFGWLFVSTFLSKVIQIESSLEIVVGHLRVLRKHRQLRQCAFKTLQKFVDVGARISDRTGLCEGLPHSWARDQTIESGYGYVEKVHVRIDYEPPFVVDYEKTWNIPGVLNPGAKIDIHMKWAKFNSTTLVIHLNDEGLVYTLDIICMGVGNCYAHEYHYSTALSTWEPNDKFDLPHKFRTSDQWKISFVAQRNTLYILVDDEVVMAKKLTIVFLNNVRSVKINTHDPSYTPKIRIQSFEFTEA